MQEGGEGRSALEGKVRRGVGDGEEVEEAWGEESGFEVLFELGGEVCCRGESQSGWAQEDQSVQGEAMEE